MERFCLLVELPQGGYVTNGATLPSLYSSSNRLHHYEVQCSQGCLNHLNTCQSLLGMENQMVDPFFLLNTKRTFV